MSAVECRNINGCMHGEAIYNVEIWNSVCFFNNKMIYTNAINYKKQL